MHTQRQCTSGFSVDWTFNVEWRVVQIYIFLFLTGTTASLKGWSRKGFNWKWIAENLWPKRTWLSDTVPQPWPPGNASGDHGVLHSGSITKAISLLVPKTCYTKKPNSSLWLSYKHRASLPWQNPGCNQMLMMRSCCATANTFAGIARIGGGVVVSSSTHTNPCSPNVVQIRQQ